LNKKEGDKMEDHVAHRAQWQAEIVWGCVMGSSISFDVHLQDDISVNSKGDHVICPYLDIRGGSMDGIWDYKM